MLRGFILALTLCLVSTTAHATVDWVDGFEYADIAAQGAVWPNSCGAGNTLQIPSTDRHFSGSKSLKGIYSDLALGTCFMDRDLGGLSDTQYGRIYMWINGGWVNNSGVPAKMVKLYQNNTYPNFWFELANGSTNWEFDISNCWDRSPGFQDCAPGPYNSYAVPGGNIPTNGWQCIEWQVTMNTPGVADGIVRSWLNTNTVLMNSTNNNWRNSVADVPNFNRPTSSMFTTQFYTQHGVGTVYFDDYAVSRDARIGCGSVPSDTTNPLPATLSIGTPTATTLTASWSGDSDNVGVTGRRLDASTSNLFGSFVSGFNNLDVGNVLSKVITGLTSGTTYFARVRSYDAAGNISINSNTASGTPVGDTTPPSTPTGFHVASIAAFLLLAGGILYGITHPRSLPADRLALRDDHVNSTTLRTVAVHRSTNDIDAEYQVHMGNPMDHPQAPLLDTPPNHPRSHHSEEA